MRRQSRRLGNDDDYHHDNYDDGDDNNSYDYDNFDYDDGDDDCVHWKIWAVWVSDGFAQFHPPVTIPSQGGWAGPSSSLLSFS